MTPEMFEKVFSGNLKSIEANFESMRTNNIAAGTRADCIHTDASDLLWNLTGPIFTSVVDNFSLSRPHLRDRRAK